MPAATALSASWTTVRPTSHRPGRWIVIGLVLLALQLTSVRTALAAPPSEPPPGAASTRAQGLRAEAAAAFEAGDAARARALLERSLSINGAGGPGDELGAAETLLMLGVVLDTLEDSAGAADALRRSLAIRERLLGPDAPAVAEVLTALADYHRTRGEAAEAGLLLARALTILEHSLGASHPDVAQTLHVLGSLHQDQSHNDLARQAFERALSIIEQAYGPGDVRTAKALGALAALHVVLGQFDIAAPMVERVIAIYETSTGNESIELATAVNNLAVIRFQTGDYTSALTLYERSRSIYVNRLGADHQYVASVLGNMAEANALLGEYGAALPLADQALAMKERLFGPDHAEVVIALANLAALYQAIGRYDRAIDVLARARLAAEKTLGPDHADLAKVLASTGQSWHAARRFDLALPLFEEAARLYAGALGPRHVAVAKTLDRIAALQLDADRPIDARDPASRALDYRIETLGPRHPDVARSLDRMARIEQALGQPDAARERWRTALPIAVLSANRDVLWQIERGLSHEHAARGESTLAIFWGKQSIAAIQSLRSSIASLDKASRSAFLVDKRRAFSELAEALVAADRVAEAEQVMDLLKDEEFLEFVRRDKDAAGAGGAVTFNDAEREADQDLGRLQKTLEAPPYEPASARVEVEAFFRRLQATLAPPAAPASRPDRTGPDLRQQALARRAQQGKPAASLQYLSGDDVLTLVLTTAAGRTVRTLPIGRDELGARVAAFRWALQDTTSDPRRLGVDLYDLLIRPVQNELRASEARTLLLTLDGPLRYLPFSALVDDNGYLIETFAVVLDSGRPGSGRGTTLAGASTRATGLGVTRAFPEQNFAALAVVREELEGIINPKGLAGEVHLDEQFTRAQLTQGLNSRVLHVASHFRFIPGSDRSFLLLGDGSALTLRDVRVEKMDFRRLELLTLSACETAMGGGPDEEGIEVEGLGVLAQRQGAQAVLASLWSVADRSTGVLMQRFYAGHEQSRADWSESMRQAQLSLLRGADSGRFEHPFHWAPFILIGDSP